MQDLHEPTEPITDPFALMMNPEAVFKALAESEHLQALKRRICRPLDKPLIPKVGLDLDDDDQAIAVAHAEHAA